MNILLGVTGSVAARLTPKLVQALSELGTVQVIVTEAGRALCQAPIPVQVYRDEHERNLPWCDPWRGRILHTDLKNWADIMVIAPCTANTMAKIANGLADNLLTNVVLAWPRHKPLFVAPAMNVDMWENPLTRRNVLCLKDLFWHSKTPIIEPQKKLLACGDEGQGALADIDRIIKHVKQSLTWHPPLDGYRDSVPFIPEGDHPGSFGAKRKFDAHTGVDLYVPKGSKTTVYPVENGVVVDIFDFTGPGVKDQQGREMSWWNPTKAMAIKGASGVVVYGEIQPNPDIKVGDKICPWPLAYSEPKVSLGHVIPVLPDGKERPDIPHHSSTMLHLELYESVEAERAFRHGTWEVGADRPAGLLDPTPLLKESRWW